MESYCCCTRRPLTFPPRAGAAPDYPQLVEKLKAEGEVQQGRMEALILQHKAEATVRDSMVGEAAAAAAARDPAVPVRPSGPLQV